MSCSSAHADGPTFTGDLQLGAGLPTAGHLGPPSYYDDHARVGVSGLCDIALGLNDRVAIEVLVGLGYLLELDAQNDDAGSVVGLAAFGPKIRLLDSRRLSASLHVGYYHLDGHQAGFDLGLGYDFGLAETWDLSVFGRYALTFRGTETAQRDQHFDALVIAGIGVRFGRIVEEARADEAAPTVVAETAPEPEPAPPPAQEVEPLPPVVVESEPAPAVVAQAEPALEPPPSPPPTQAADVAVATVGTHAPYVVRFAYGDDEIRDAGLLELRRLARWLRAHPEARRLRIVGHTDPRGDAEHNARLSVNRARAVRDFLVQAGFVPSRFELEGVGPSEPVVPDATTESEHRRNRRVEIIVAE